MISLYLTQNDKGYLNSDIKVDYALGDEVYVYDIVCIIFDTPRINILYRIAKLEDRILSYVEKHSLSIKVYINNELRIKKNNKIEG